MDEETKRLLEELKAAVGLVKGLGERVAALETKAQAGEEIKGDVEALREALAEIQVKAGPGDGDSVETKAVLPSSVICTEENEEIFRKHGKVVIPVEKDVLGLCDLEQKTLIDSAAVGSATSGILVPDRIRTVVPLAQRRLTLREILPNRPCTSNVIEFPKESIFTDATSPQAEGNAKGESGLTFTIESASVATIATWLPATAQVLSDWSELGRVIDRKLRYAVALRSEQEILAGDGLGSHLSGLLTEATAYAGTYNVSGDTKLDTLRHAVLEAEDDSEYVDFCVLHPQDFHDIELLKTEDGGANKGSYLIGSPVGPARVPTLWGKSVIVSNNMQAGTFLVGASAQCEVFNRMQTQVVISTEHDDFFTKNKVAIRAEERLTLAVYRATAFIFGSF